MNNKTIKSALAKLAYLVLITACIVLYHQNVSLTEQIKSKNNKLEELSMLHKFTISQMVNQSRDK